MSRFGRRASKLAKPVEKAKEVATPFTFEGPRLMTATERRRVLEVKVFAQVLTAIFFAGEDRLQEASPDVSTRLQQYQQCALVHARLLEQVYAWLQCVGKADVHAVRDAALPLLLSLRVNSFDLDDVVAVCELILRHADDTNWDSEFFYLLDQLPTSCAHL